MGFHSLGPLSLVTSSSFGILAPVMNGFCFSTLIFEKKTLEQMKMDVNRRFCMDLRLENTLTSKTKNKKRPFHLLTQT